jgi:hypothetical protein
MPAIPDPAIPNHGEPFHAYRKSDFLAALQLKQTPAHAGAVLGIRAAFTDADLQADTGK